MARGHILQGQTLHFSCTECISPPSYTVTFLPKMIFEFLVVDAPTRSPGESRCLWCGPPTPGSRAPLAPVGVLFPDFPGVFRGRNSHVGCVLAERALSLPRWPVLSHPTSILCLTLGWGWQPWSPRWNAICDTLPNHSQSWPVLSPPASRAPEQLHRSGLQMPMCPPRKSIISDSNIVVSSTRHCSKILLIFFFPINKCKHFYTLVSVAVTVLKYLAEKIEDSWKSIVDVNSALQ